MKRWKDMSIYDKQKLNLEVGMFIIGIIIVAQVILMIYAVVT